MSSDLHLKKDRPERFHALNQLLQKAKEHKVDRLLIGGDLFDSPHDANHLRPEIRRVLKGNKMPILVIPGNHDYNCYEENLDFGDNFHPLVEQPCEVMDWGDCRFVAVPYFPGRLIDIINVLKKQKKKGAVNILIIHGSLDLAGFSRYDFGNEKEFRYLPITEQAIKELDYNYILAGHYHSERVLKKINKSLFMYPGSPVYITKRELGRRYVYLIDTDLEPKPIELNTRYYQHIELTVYPGEEKEKLIQLKKSIGEHDLQRAELEVTIEGFIKMNEKDFKEVVSRIIGNVAVNENWRQVSDLISEPLYKRIRDKIDQTDMDPIKRRKIEKMFIEAMIK